MGPQGSREMAPALWDTGSEDPLTIPPLRTILKIICLIFSWVYMNTN